MLPNGAYPLADIADFGAALSRQAGDQLRNLTQPTRLGEACKRLRSALNFPGSTKLPPEIDVLWRKVVCLLYTWQLEMDRAGAWFLNEFIDSPQYAKLAEAHDLWMQLPDTVVISKVVITNLCTQLEQFLAQSGVVRDPKLLRGATVASLPVYLKSCAMPQAKQIPEASAVVADILRNRWYRTSAAGDFIAEIARACFVVAESAAPAKPAQARQETVLDVAPKTEKIKLPASQGTGKVFEKFVVKPQGAAPLGFQPTPAARSNRPPRSLPAPPQASRRKAPIAHFGKASSNARHPPLLA